MPDPDQKRRFWEFDPTIFQPRPKTSPLRRFIVEPTRYLAKLVLILVVLTFPVLLPVLGALFGGLVFWGGFAGSLGLICLVLYKTGYAKNFDAWNPSMVRQLVGLSIGFVMAAGLFLSLVYLKTWSVPGVFAFAGLGLILVFWKKF